MDGRFNANQAQGAFHSDCDQTKTSPEPAVGCRYAGRGYEKEEDIEQGGTLLVKGLKSMWRQAAPIVRNTLQGALRRIIMQVRPSLMQDFHH